MTRLALAGLLVAALAWPAPAQPARPIRVAVDFRQTAEQRRDAGLSASGGGHIATGVVFQEVGTSLRVQASRAADLVVPSGQPVVLAGGSSRTHAVLRHLLGVAAESSRSDTVVGLTAQ